VEDIDALAGNVFRVEVPSYSLEMFPELGEQEYQPS
jgi:hypothetical protein